MNVWFILFEMLSSLLFALFEIVAQYLSLYVTYCTFDPLYKTADFISSLFESISKTIFIYTML